jgi:hypothetical protein
MSNVEPTEDDAIVTVVVKLNAVTTGLVIGVLAGFLLLVATLWLVIKGGPHVGPHLALLGQYLPGYSVTVAGSLVGFAYGLVLGFVSGYVIGALYNLVAGKAE